MWDKAKKQKLLADINCLIGGLDLGSGVTIKELEQHTLIYCSTFLGGRKALIEYEFARLPEDVYAFTYFTERYTYRMVVDDRLVGALLLLVILHEFGHLILGDVKPIPISTKLVSEGLRDFDLLSKELDLVCRRKEDMHPLREQTAELMAKL